MIRPQKLYKLIQHQKAQQKHYAGEEVAFCTKDFPNIGENDVIEIYHPDEGFPRLLLKVTANSLRDDFSHKDALSIEQTIATAFQLRPFSDVVVNKVDVATVELDSVELTFKDQYLGRSEMWRLKNSLAETCIYLNKKIEFASATIRCQVHEMWSHGDKVAAGVVTASTKIVFRSSTSMVYLFIQMSSEMWEFDIYGDLYFEKAVNGFLAELFAKWKKTGSNHDVTIVLFSRTYYDATTSEQFPPSMRECLQTDYRGRFYEDYYRVAVQNGKYEDWGSTLVYLKHLFVEYKSFLLSVHAKESGDQKLPRSFISSAAQGNFLEVLNMSLNVFEKHYMDRSCDRTGQLSVVITPGVGVFEVDRELTNVTMQRIIDNGVGSDLVCVGEQPLHAVPLLKFHNKTTTRNNVEDYSMPHWINLSFYSTNKKVGYSSYIPRIKLPVNSPLQNTVTLAKFWEWSDKTKCRIPKPRQNGHESSWPNSVYDFDEYDLKVFELPNSQIFHRRTLQRKKTSPASEVGANRVFKRQSSEPEIHQGNADLVSLNNSSFNGSSDRASLISPEPATPSPAITIPVRKIAALNHLYSSSFGALNIEVKSSLASSGREKYFYDDLWTQNNQKIMSPASTSQCGSPKDKEKSLTFSKLPKDTRLPSKALINPFDPSHAVIKLTSNRRRWTHIFPRGPTGVLIQQHHFHSNHAKLEIVHEGQDVLSDSSSPSRIPADGSNRSGRNSISKQAGEGNLALMWGATGEQEWTPALQTGVDWKSLTIPACLPITTDYFPDERSLQMDYVVSDYSLLPDDVNADYAQQRVVYRRPLTTREVFSELVSQRLAQGFQLIVQPKAEKQEKGTPKPVNPSLIRSNNRMDETDCEECFLSIGRVFHKITLEGSTIVVTRYRPRHAYPSIKIHYRYRFHAPNNCNYEVSSAEFSTEKLENYNWNYVDHYICTRGDRDFGFVEALKYWRFRMYLLPNFQSGSKKIQDGAERTNVFSPLTDEEKCCLADGFLKFIELCINRLRRPTATPKKGGRGICNPQLSSGVFRERAGSNRLGERPRSRSGSKGVPDRWAGTKPELNGRISPGDTNSFFFEGKSLHEQSGSLPDFSQDFPVSSSTVEGGDEPVSPPRLSSIASLRNIADAIQSPLLGFPFIKSNDLPIRTFVSADAVTWLITHMEGIATEEDAVRKFNCMIEEKLITHASGDMCHQFINGFYLYCIPATNQDGIQLEKRMVDLAMFQNDWMEVELNHERFKLPDQHPAADYESGFRREDLPSSRSNQDFILKRGSPLYKQVYMDVDAGKKSDRQEWGHVRYQSTYKPDEAFEMVTQWIQATGSIITDLVQGWSRKAQQCNMQLVPIPSDPFALPCSSKSDSLRGPIFIPLNVESIMENRSHLFEGFPEQSWNRRMFLLQESIVFQFGFLRSLNPSECDPNHHYVHCSGNMFVFIPTSAPENQSIRITDSPGRFRRLHESPVAMAMVGSHDDYITRHVSGKNKDSFQEDKRVGFLWSWNYMLSKRWKTSSTPALGDENYMMKVLRDFQAFCDNQDNRLQQFWKNSDPAFSEAPSEG